MHSDDPVVAIASHGLNCVVLGVSAGVNVKFLFHGRCPLKPRSGQT